MGININSRILLSVASITAAVALIVGATFAFFSDTETSTGNTLAAGSLDLRVDNTCTYNGIPCAEGEGLETTWQETDLVPGVHKFFNFDDIKPGDNGEDTVSLHVVDNNAWARFSVDEVSDLDVTCTEPESESTDTDCNPAETPGDGELQEALNFEVWLDQGTIPGFQGTGDTGEGDNIFNFSDVQLATPGPIDDGGENYDLWTVLAGVRSALGIACDTDDDDGDGVTPGGTGACQGLPTDGHLVGSTTYYFGIGWELPENTGNEAQSDEFVADMIFEAVQHRNNPTQQGFTP